MSALAAAAQGVLFWLPSLIVVFLTWIQGEPPILLWFYVSQGLLFLLSTLFAAFFLLWLFDRVKRPEACSSLGTIVRAAVKGFPWFLILFVACGAAVRLSITAIGIADYLIFGLFKQYLTAKAFSVALSTMVSGSLAFLFFATAAALHQRMGLPTLQATHVQARAAFRPYTGAVSLAVLVIAANAAYLFVQPSLPALKSATEGVEAIQRLAGSARLVPEEVALRDFNTAAVDGLCIKALSSSAAGDAKAAELLFGFAGDIDNTRESLYLARGIHELAVGHVRQASEDLRKLVWMNGRSAEAWWYLGEIEDMAKEGGGRLAKKNAFRLDEMILFKTSLARPGSRPKEWLQGQAAVGEALFSLALKAVDNYALRLVIAREKVPAMTLLYRRLESELKSIEKEIPKTATTVSPRIAELWADHLLMSAMAGYDVGRQTYELARLLLNNPEDAKRTERLGRTLKSHFAQASAGLLKEFSDRYPNNLDIKLANAQRLITSAQYAQAREVITGILARDGRHVEARKLLVALNAANGREEEAEKGALELLGEGVDDAALHSILGNLYQARFFRTPASRRNPEDFKRAISHYEKGVALEPTNFVHYRNLAEVYHAAKDHARAREYADRVVAVLGDALAWGTPQWFWHSNDYLQATPHNWGVFLDFARTVEREAGSTQGK